MLNLISILSEDFADRERFDAIVYAGARSMSVDIIDILRFKSGIFESKLHTADSAATFRMRVGNAVGVRGNAVAGNFTINFGAARFGMF